MKRANRVWSIILFLITGAALVGASADLRAEDWAIYVTYLILINATLLFVVEVLPGLGLCLPELAATLGFLYIGGAPIALFFFLNTMFIAPHLVRWLHLRATTFTDLDRITEWRNRSAVGYAADASTFVIGLTVRWQVASSIAGSELPVTDGWTILASETCGYLAWASTLR